MTANSGRDAIARKSATVARGVARSDRDPPAPPPNETVPGSKPRLLRIPPCRLRPCSSVRSPWCAAIKSGSVLA